MSLDGLQRPYSISAMWLGWQFTIDAASFWLHPAARRAIESGFAWIGHAEHVHSVGCLVMGSRWGPRERLGPRCG